MKEIKLAGVPETMLQTIYARAKETRTRCAIHDDKAVEVAKQIDYDFSLADKDKAMHDGVIARTIILDRLTSEYLKGNEGAVVVNIAAGLDTRCYRMRGYSHWYNLDLPDVIDVRARVLPEDGVISQIAASAMDDWTNLIKEHDVPALVIIEGLTMYLDESDVKRIFEVISSCFSKVRVFAEIMNPMVVKHFREKSIEGSNAEFSWGIRDGKALSSLITGFEFKEEHSLTEGMAEIYPVYKLLGRIPMIRGISNRIAVLEKGE